MLKNILGYRNFFSVLIYRPTAFKKLYLRNMKRKIRLFTKKLYKVKSTER